MDGNFIPLLYGRHALINDCNVIISSLEGSNLPKEVTKSVPWCTTHQWGRGVMVKHGGSYHRDCQFHSSMCHNENGIGEDGNWKSTIHFPRKNGEPWLWFLLRLQSSMQHSNAPELRKSFSKAKLAMKRSEINELIFNSRLFVIFSCTQTM